MFVASCRLQDNWATRAGPWCSSRAVGAGAGWGSCGVSWCWDHAQLPPARQEGIYLPPGAFPARPPGDASARSCCCSSCSQLSSLSPAGGKGEVSAEQEPVCAGKLDLFWDRPQGARPRQWLRCSCPLFTAGSAPVLHQPPLLTPLVIPPAWSNGNHSCDDQ